MLKHGLLLAIFLVLATVLTGAETVKLDGRGPGLTFDGLGGLSAGAGTRLLFDYPEPQRSDVLDLLFKPNFGAALHHLKVEIGGDVNSTEGSEPSYARTREEFEHPKPEYFNRGYEWWLMCEAKKRNPKIFLDVLQWGAPDWIGDKDFPDAGDVSSLTWQQRMARNRKKFYTQDNADFIAGFIQGAKKYHNLDIDYCGVWNETRYDVPWIKLLRKTLDRRWLPGVGITADDGFDWQFAEEVAKDPELKNAIHVVGNHYSGSQSTATAKQLGKTLWASEDHAGWQPGWPGACALAKQYNRNYLDGRMTKTIICYLIASYYDTLSYPNCASIRANTPWSGHYDVWPVHWAIAHTTQFAQPGWKYLDAGCGTLKDGGSYVTLRSPEEKGDYSIIIETGDAKTPQELAFQTTGGLSVGSLHVFRSNAESQFEQIDDIIPRDGGFAIVLQPSSIYSLTTTTGQKKGTTEIPPDKDFPYPYHEDFEHYNPEGLPKYFADRSLPPNAGFFPGYSDVGMAKYFADQSGTFEVAFRPDGGKCLRQTVARRGIDWNAYPTPEPYTVLGSDKWYNYEVSCDVNIEHSGYAALFGRIRNCLMSNADPPHGYWIKVNSDGRWELKSFNVVLKSGTVSFAADKWHKLAMTFSGPKIAAMIDGVEVAAFEEDKPYFDRGIIGLGTGWNTAMFDNLSVQEIPGTTLPVNLASGKKATASSTYGSHGDVYDPRFAIDGDLYTRWNSAIGNENGCWLAVDLGSPTRFDRVSVRQFERRIGKYKIQYEDGGGWRDAFEGEADGEYWEAHFPAVRGTKMRILIETTKGNITPSIYELGVYNDGK